MRFLSRWVMVLAGSGAAAGPITAQVLRSGQVIDGDIRQGVAGALVRALVGEHSALADHQGRFYILTRSVDTLVIAAIGYLPDTIPVAGPGSADYSVELRRSPVVLADIAVAAPGTIAPSLVSVGRWQLSRELLRALPFSIEPDAFRALSLAPSVSFSSPMSARPHQRGYDANDAGLRVDGYELFNFYHLGRAFSAFPPAAIDRITLTTGPGSVRDGGTLGGTLDISGRAGSRQDPGAGAELSPASLTAWGEAGSARFSGFGSVRVANFAIADVVPGAASIPYRFVDGYLRAGLTRRLEVTLLASHDRLGTETGSGIGAVWDGSLLGTRLRLLNGRLGTLDASSSVSAFDLRSDGISITRGPAAVRNRYRRAGLELGGRLVLGHLQLSGGAVLADRRIQNDIRPTAQGAEVLEQHVEVRGVEPAAYTEISGSLGPLSVTAGMRVDLSREVTAWQPRAALTIPLGRQIQVSLSGGRSSRTFHLAADAVSEPDLDFVEYWLPAGAAGVPVPMVDHLTAQVDVLRGPWQLRSSAYVSRGRGLIELPAPETAATAYFVETDARTRGLETRITWTAPAGRMMVTGSYALAWSDRRSQDDQSWHPWSLDRRHQLRLFAQRSLGNWELSSLLDIASGLPFTPVSQILPVALPGAGDFRGSQYLFGETNSARGGGTFRLDAGARYRFGGPGQSRMSLGLSVINLGFGPVAPMRAGPLTGPRVEYERIYSLTAVPSVTLGIEF